MRTAVEAARILVVDDEAVLAGVIAENLESEGYRVEIVGNGRDAGRLWSENAPDLVVLDVMLPGMDGFDLCRTMRQRGDTTPILFLSARGDPADRIRGLEVGGDDYLPKPFHLPEFLLRVNNLLRRRGWGFMSDASLQIGPHRVNLRSWTAELADGRREPLGERELGIIRLLVERANEVVSRDEILDQVWGEDAFPSSRSIDNYVMRLRKLFESEPTNPVYIHTVWGVGYRFTPAGKDQSTT